MTTTTIPTGTMGLAKRHLRLALADSPAFRSWVGASIQAEALNRIYIDDLPPPQEKSSTDPASDEATYSDDDLDLLRPFAIVGVDENNPMSKTLVARGGGNHYTASGSLTLHLEQNVPEAIRAIPSEIATRWENTVESICDEVLSVAGTSGYLDVQDYAILMMRIVHPDRESAQGFHQMAICSFDWSGL